MVLARNLLGLLVEGEVAICCLKPQGSHVSYHCFPHERDFNRFYAKHTRFIRLNDEHGGPSILPNRAWLRRWREAFVSPEERWFDFPLDVKLREYSLVVTFLWVETLGGASLPFVGKKSDRPESRVTKIIKDVYRINFSTRSGRSKITTSFKV